MLEPGFVSGAKVVASAGTAVALSATELHVYSIRIEARKAAGANTGVVYIGGSNVADTNGIIVPEAGAGELVIKGPEIAGGGSSRFNLANIFIDAATTADGVVFMYQTHAPQNAFS